MEHLADAIAQYDIDETKIMIQTNILRWNEMPCPARKLAYHHLNNKEESITAR